MNPIATIIIPQYNHPHLTVACLQSFRRCEPAPVEFIVVDDGSTSSDCQKVARLCLPNVRFIQQPHSGITAAWNHAANQAASPHLIFVNNDTLCRGAVVDRLISPLRSTAILTGPTPRRESSLPPDVLTCLPTEYFIEGWCMALLSDDFQRSGCFDESMKLYFSDTDLQARLLQLAAAEQRKLQPIPHLPLVHAAHQTTRHLPTRRQQWCTDRHAFIRKWNSPLITRCEL